MGLRMTGKTGSDIQYASRIFRFGGVVALLWTLLISYSLYWEHQQNKEEARTLGRMQGQAFFEKDILYRRWASRHGGVYVPVTESTPPNPYLSHVPERDITTPSGRQLTLINPAYMTRQVFEMAQEYTGTGRGHITSLKPLRAANVPDTWERQVLQRFESGLKELGQIEQIDGKPYYRYMKALIAEKPCLKCHASQGYLEGQVRGGLSVSVPLEPVYAMLDEELSGVYLNHGAIWLLGLGIIGLGTRRINGITTALQDKAVELEYEIEERQVAQEALQDQTVILEEEIAERRNIEEVVRVSEEKFSKSFDNAPIMMSISTEVEGTYLDVNKKFLKISGFSREEIIGRTSVELGWLTQEQRQTLVDKIRSAGSISDMAVIARSKQGKPVSCQFSGEYITVEGNKCILLLAHDVTEQKAMEEQLRQSQKMEAIGQLAGGVAHDFNNILTVIMGYSNLLQMDPKLTEHQKDEVEQIISSADKAAQLTRGLLAFSRKETMNLKKVNINDIVQHVQKFLVRVIGEDIHLKTTVCGQTLTVCADNTQIEQVLINLATNARDAMPDGGSISVETDLQEIDDSFVHIHGYGVSGRYARITLSDSGCGMDEETCTKIFEPFFTTKESGKGTGLGMAIVYGIIKQHNGFINVYSEPGQGTTFRIYLPIIEADDTSSVETASVVAPVAGGSETILVVEDNSSVRTLVQTILESYGYRIILALDGQDGVEQFIAHRDEIKLVLMDVIMPRKNGQEALQEIWGAQPDVKAIYLSGYTADFIQNRGLENSNVELVMKPIQPIELLRTVRVMLDRDCNRT